MTATDRPGEDDLIARFFRPIAGADGLGLRDDAARLVPGADTELVVTTDAIVAGVHFFPDDPAQAIARKALGVNLSDLAAKGAQPRGFVLTLALPDDWKAAWLGAFAEALGEAATSHGCPLIGGDTVRTPGPLLVSITAFGETPRGAMVTRFTARPGDRICVTGTIGDAALGLALRLDPGAAWTRGLALDARLHLTDRYLHPQPRLAAARAVREHARAAMDVSDGLAGDLAKMCRESGTSAEVDLALLPLSTAARAAIARAPDLLDRCITGGDDYEILCAVPDESLASFLESCAQAGVPAAAVGRMIEGDALPVFRDAGVERRYVSGSYRHF